MRALAAILALTLAQPGFSLTDDALRKWQEDLAFVRAELPARHRDLFHATSREEFHRLLAGLESELPNLSEDQVIVRLAEIVRKTVRDRDGHSGVMFFPRFRLIPVNFFLYTDGLHVRGVSKEYAALAAARVLSIGGLPIDDAIKRAWTIASGDNDMTRRADVALILAMPAALRALGVASGEPHAPIEIAGVRPDGSKVAMSVSPVESFDGLEWIDVRRQSDQVPLFLRHADPNPFRWYAPKKALWFEHLPDQKTLYVHYGAVADTPEESVAAFFARVFAFVDTNPVEKLVVDLRQNGGGNNMLNRPFLHGMIKRDDGIGRSGRFFVLIGRHTFSAAQNIVTKLENETNVLFAGEPTGGAPNHYGDATRLRLPNSGVVIRASTLWWQDAHPNDERLWIGPHLAAELSADDDRAGRDPALEAVLAYKPERSVADLVRAALASGGKSEASAVYAKWRNDPRRKYVAAEGDLTPLALALFGEKKPEQAVTVFELNADAYPQSWRAHESLGRAYQSLKRNDEALASYKRAAALSEKAVLSKERITQLTAQ